MIGRWLRSLHTGPAPQPVATVQQPPGPTELAPFATTLAAPDFVFGAWHCGESQAPYFQHSAGADAFVFAAYRGQWVRPEIRWSDFAAGEDYRRMRSDPSTIAVADVDQLSRLPTTLIRGDRFNEGLLASAFGAGTLLAIARRMAALADQSSNRSVAGSRSPA